MAKTPEGRVKDKIKDLFAKYPHLFFDMPVPGGYGKSTLDFICCINGLFFAVEAKAPDKEPTKRQEGLMNDILAAGGAVFVVAGDDQYGFNQLKMFLDANSAGCTSIRSVPRNNA